MTLKIYHNPRCSKSRATLELLQSKGLNPQVIEYLKTPPSVAELDTILKALHKDPQDIIRTKEEIYAELQLDSKKWSRTELLKILNEHPVLLERPIVVKDDKAAIGRPPENILAILD